MPASTVSRALFPLLLAAAVFAWPAPGQAKPPQVAIECSTDLSRLDCVAKDCGGLIDEELRRCGWYSLSSAPDVPQYTIKLKLLAFGSAARDSLTNTGPNLRDLQKRLGEGTQIDQVKLQLDIEDTATHEQLCSRIVEGLESRKGTSISSENPAYFAGLNLSSDEFRRSSLGRAGYKALADALNVIYEVLPLQGNVQAITDDAVVVDLDAASGLRKGDDLEVVRDLPVTSSDGSPVWHEYRRIGLVRVIDFQPGHCLCLAVEGQGKLAEGDLARPLLSPVWFPDEADRDP